jgi:hypothetical protein
VAAVGALGGAAAGAAVGAAACGVGGAVNCGLASLASMLLEYGAALIVSQRQGVARVFAVLA